jgi:hypothetical protein
MGRVVVRATLTPRAFAARKSLRTHSAMVDAVHFDTNLTSLSCDLDSKQLHINVATPNIASLPNCEHMGHMGTQLLGSMDIAAPFKDSEQQSQDESDIEYDEDSEEDDPFRPLSPEPYIQRLQANAPSLPSTLSALTMSWAAPLGSSATLVNTTSADLLLSKCVFGRWMMKAKNLS